MRIDTGSPEQVGLVRITKYVVFLDSCLPRVINSCSTHRFVDMSESDSSNCQTPVVNSPSSEMPSNELRGQIYATCRDGDLLRLRAYVENRSKDKLGELVNSATNGATPLIMACRNGHVPVVTFLVNRCGADIELCGSVTFDSEVIEGAPPLWCASAAGHAEIVKFLIRCGANVNKTTLTNSTPLRAACFDGHVEIVQYLVEKGADLEIANRHGHTCLMIACYKGHQKIVRYLLERGADVNRKSLKGNTALHDCAESGSLEIMKMLFGHEAKMEKDFYGLTPLLAAAVAGHSRIVEYLTTLPTCSSLEHINAYELLGATFVDKKRDIMGASKLWKAAMSERWSKGVKAPRPGQVAPALAYGNAVEPQSAGELAELVLDPDAVRMHALVVRERVLGPGHPDTAYYVRYRGAVYADSGDFSRCILLWMHALDMQRKHFDALSPATQSSFLSFAELFVFMLDGGRRRRAVATHPPAFVDVLAVLKRAVEEMERGMTAAGSGRLIDREKNSLSRFLIIVVHLVALAARVAGDNASRHQLRAVVYNLVRMNPRGPGRRTPLHLACSGDTTDVGRYPVARFPDVEAIAALLDASASIDTVDAARDSPLHVAARCRPPRPDVVQLLLARGAHHDVTNGNGETLKTLLESGDDGLPLHRVVPPGKYLTLQCLAARVISEFRIEYRGHVPRRLEAFIRMH